MPQTDVMGFLALIIALSAYVATIRLRLIDQMRVAGQERRESLRKISRWLTAVDAPLIFSGLLLFFYGFWDLTLGLWVFGPGAPGWLLPLSVGIFTVAATVLVAHHVAAWWKSIKPGSQAFSAKAADCPFCNLLEGRVWISTAAGYAIKDAHPISPGHTLVIPQQHVGSIYDLPSESLMELWALVGKVRTQLVLEHHPDGFNIGINDGKAAGQSVAHAHIHVIPRFQGDVPDPRGGIRWVIPEKAPYWK